MASNWERLIDDDDDDPLDDLNNMSFSDLQMKQQQVMKDQDAGLDTLAQVIGRQKQMALQIGNEVDDHNALIDDITDHVDRTDQRLISETRHIDRVSRKSGTCWYWVVIILLLVTIIILMFIPRK